MKGDIVIGDIIIKTNCVHHTFDYLEDLIESEEEKEEQDKDMEKIERYKNLLAKEWEVSHFCKASGDELNEHGCGDCKGTPINEIYGK